MVLGVSICLATYDGDADLGLNHLFFGQVLGQPFCPLR